MLNLKCLTFTSAAGSGVGDVQLTFQGCDPGNTTENTVTDLKTGHVKVHAILHGKSKQRQTRKAINRFKKGTKTRYNKAEVSRQKIQRVNTELTSEGGHQITGARSESDHHTEAKPTT